MFDRRLIRVLVSGTVASMFLTGCFGNKNQDVATAPAPPPAAYPDTSAANGLAGSSAPAASVSYPFVPAAPSAPAAPGVPAPFSLREGEQLVQHQIQSGENLSSIAAKYNSSISRIQAANGMTDTKIFAGKSLQVPTSAPPVNLAQNQTGAYPGTISPAPAAVAPSYPTAPVGAYPSTTGAPGVPAPVVPTAPAPSYPGSSASPGAISPPTVPQSPGLPGYPASTSYPRTAPTPSFEASRIQFSN